MKCSFHILIIISQIIAINSISYYKLNNQYFISPIKFNNNVHIFSNNNDIFVDTCKITVKAGDGGNGCLSFRREKHVPLGGPSGGSGGHGGDVYLIGDKSLTTLYQIKLQTYFRAFNGQHGMGSQRRGMKGKDNEIKIPLGTLIYDENGNLVGEITFHNQKIRVARGGRGGRGNFSFRSQRNTAPCMSEKGEIGITRDLYLTYKILGDVGLIGLPNSGKSLLLSRVTNAHPKIGPFPFCTTKPNLGVYPPNIQDELNPISCIDIESKDSNNYRIIIADIPGIIEGAHQGKGLGLDFLKHIQKCHILVHIIDSSSEDPIKDYEIVNKEMEYYDPKLLDKVQIILLNKSDLVSSDYMELLIDKFKRMCNNDHVYSISALKDEDFTELFNLILKKRDCVKISNVNEEIIESKSEYLEEIDDFTLYNPRDYQINKITDGIYRLDGKYLERKVSMMNLDQHESVLWLNRLLTKYGVMSKIRACGGRPNDVLFIGNYEFIIPKF